MPKMSDTMEEGVLVAWLADEGAAVSAGDVIAQVETDKATMDLEVYDDGVLLKRVVGEGDSVPIGALIAVLGKEGEDPSDVVGKYGGDGAAGDGADVEVAAPAADDGNAAPAGLDGITATADAIDAPAPSAQPVVQPVGGSSSKGTASSGSSSSGSSSRPDAAPGGTTAEGYGHRPDGAEPTSSASDAGASSRADGGRVKASPLARRMAEEAGLELAQIAGTGPDGRVVKRDVEKAKEQGPAPAPKVTPVQAPAAQPASRPSAPAPAASPVASGGEDVRITQMRKTIAKRLAQSKFTAPHFYLTVDVDMRTAMGFRGEINALTEKQGLAKVSYNDLVTKACASALRRHPMVNASYLEDEGVIRKHDGAHVAVAVAMDEGLITPVVRDADRKGLARHRRRDARARRPRPRRQARPVRVLGLDVHDLEPGHVRDRRVHGHHQPAQRVHPGHRRHPRRARCGRRGRGPGQGHDADALLRPPRRRRRVRRRVPGRRQGHARDALDDAGLAASRPSPPTSMPTLAHLSDVHFGRIADARVVDALVDEVNRAAVDLVVVSGDLTQRARRSEFRAARAMLDRFGPPTIVVPGNHDVRAWWHHPVDRVWRPTKRFRRFITADLRPSHVGPGLAAFGINSAHGLTIKGGRIRRSAVSAMEAFFQKQPPDAFRVLVLHHHLLHLEALGDHDVSRGARRALEAARRSRVDLVLCGHLHVSHVAPVELEPPDASDRDGHRLVIASAGTATSNRGRGTNRGTNVYNWVEVGPDAFTVRERQFDLEAGAFREVRATPFDRDRRPAA